VCVCVCVCVRVCVDVGVCGCAMVAMWLLFCAPFRLGMCE